MILRRTLISLWMLITGLLAPLNAAPFMMEMSQKSYLIDLALSIGSTACLAFAWTIWAIGKFRPIHVTACVGAIILAVARHVVP